MHSWLKATSATALVLAASLLAPLGGGGAALAQASPAPATTAAVKTVDADPALWVVRDKDTTIYLFGTVHILKPGLSWFDEEVRAAFDRSGELVTEVIEPDQAAMAPLIMKLAVDPDGPPLSQKLGAKADAYKKAMEGVGVPWQAFEQFKPWMAAITLAVAPLPKLGYDVEKGSEKELERAAKAAGKPLGELETVEEQLGFFDSLSEADQIAFLNAAVEGLPDMETQMASMVDAWAKGDPETLGRIINAALLETPRIGKVLLQDRNARWATWIDNRLDRPGTVFVAVGAGHLAGKGSVQDKLRARKLKARRVKY